MRHRLPGLSTKKLHKLLYYCQGHHLAAFGVPLFHETISAWDMGPVVGALWRAERSGDTSGSQRELGDAELNTVGYVVSRYGRLTGTDLEHLTHSETPWQYANTARMPSESARIELEWIREYFSTAGAVDDDDEFPVDAAEVRAILKGAEARRNPEPRPDDPQRLRARIAQMRAQLDRSA
ncbi:Panacea domain-containing protein [Plantactinospora sp. WMMB782]|uniref:Panacea domain-containing protein n=1 Tax=Plantactinospora sp. WMMB782 TaxID=3404121 RepID=UPI003B9654E3